MKLHARQIEGLLEKRENERVEFKRAESALPENLWETYSAFCSAECARNLPVMLNLSRIGCLTLLLLMLCTGCLTNNYERYFVGFSEEREMAPVNNDAPVLLRRVIAEEDVIGIIEDGYVAIGASSFRGPYTPYSFAVDTAKKHGAALVLLDVRFKEKKQYTSVMYLPSYSTTYSAGMIGGHCYSGNSTTTMVNAVPVQQDVDVFDHDAMFFRKVDIAKTYGIRWSLPKRLPNESHDAPIKVYVMAVLHGSEAEKKGVRRGQVVTAINGTLIRSRKDIEPFLADERSITDVEVANAL